MYSAVQPYLEVVLGRGGITLVRIVSCFVNYWSPEIDVLYAVDLNYLATQAVVIRAPASECRLQYACSDVHSVHIDVVFNDGAAFHNVSGHLS